MASIFTKIINGEIPSYKVIEDESHFAFLDIFPTAKGHTLVVPKHEVDNLFDLPENEYRDLQMFARKVAKGIQKAIPCNRVGVTVIGLDVPHAHIHLIPINSVSDISFEKEKLKFSTEEFIEIAKLISDNI
ncbi:MAG: HIT family protein [Flavobacteriales bacterium]|nr:HIT family protein [Flavobacteriales bacterium]